MPIIVYNRTKESHDYEINIPIYRPHILGNPFTHIKDKKTKAMFIVKDRDEAISNYEHYFDVMYNSNIAFKRAIDNLYEL